jgi:hypothetical protein
VKGLENPGARGGEILRFAVDDSFWKVFEALVVLVSAVSAPEPSTFGVP